MDQPIIAVVTTVATREDAERIARELVEQRLAACVQISAIDSFYRWRDAVQHDAEFRLLAKTRADQYQAMEAAIRALHPYELPAIHAFGCIEAEAAYAAWVAESCSRQPVPPAQP